MKTLKLLTVLGLIFAVSGTASALSLGGYTGQLEIKYDNWDMGTLYAPNQVATNEAAVDLLGQNSPLGGEPGEDGWLVFRIKSISMASGAGTTLWADGPLNDTELVGIGYGITDVAVYTGAPDPGTGNWQTYVFSVGATYDIWEQPKGNFDPSLGSGGRLAGLDAYTGVGTPGGVAGASLLVRAETIDGIDPYGESIPLFTPDADTFEQVYDFDGVAGLTHSFLNATAGEWGDDDLSNGEMISGVFSDPISGAPGKIADMRMKSSSWFYDPDTDPNTDDDWFFKSHDPIVGTYAVPEPLTMLALFGGITGLGGYIRKRRMA
jgi:hypothetical protein